jgi:aspartate/methionine/tyrosine aminotransferase
VRRNFARLTEIIARHPALTLLVPEAGWSAIVRVPATEPEEDLVIRLLNDESVLVHPGYFFDISEEAFLVLSLLPSPDVFDEAVARIMSAVPGERV